MEFKRDYYLQKLIRAEQNDMVKIVTGVRRCGKSYLLFNIFRNHLLSQGVAEDHIIGLALDDRQNKKLLDPDKLLDYIDEHIVNDGKTNYVILDEVQLVDDFVGVLLSLGHMRNVQTYVSGSNSKFLSKDVVTEFRGRGDVVEVHPLSFAEYYSHVGGDKIAALDGYLVYGGMPFALSKGDAQSKREYLAGLFDEVYMRDIAERYEIERPSVLSELVEDLCSCKMPYVCPRGKPVMIFTSTRELDRKFAKI